MRRMFTVMNRQPESQESFVQTRAWKLGLYPNSLDGLTVGDQIVSELGSGRDCG